MDYKRLAIPFGAGLAGALIISATGAQKSLVAAAALVGGTGGGIALKVKEDIEDKKLSNEDLKKELAAVNFLIFLAESGVLDVPENFDTSREYLDETEEVTEDFLQNWKSYGNERFDQLYSCDKIIDVLFEYSDLLNRNYSFHSESHPPLQEWVRKALCASAMSIHYYTSRNDEWFNAEVKEKVKFFVLNIRREWAEFLIRLLVFLDAMEQTQVGIKKDDAYNASVDKLVRNLLVETYEEINNECTLMAQGMDSWVKKLMTKTSFTESDPPQLHINDIEDGRQEVFWGNKDSVWKEGKSCTYLVDWNGGAYVKETNEFVVFKDWKQFPFIAATIIQDVFGPYDHEYAVEALGEDIQKYLVNKKQEKKDEAGDHGDQDLLDKHYHSVSSENISDINSKNIDQTTIYFDAGIKYKESEEYLNACNEFDKAIALNPNEEKFYLHRAISKEGLGEYKEALFDYSKAIELNPLYANAFNGLGNVKSSLGDNEGAVKHYTKAISIDPNYAVAYYNRGYSKAELGDHSSAIDDFTKSLEIDPDDPDAYMNRGISKAELGDNEAGYEDFKKAKELEDADKSKDDLN